METDCCGGQGSPRAVEPGGRKDNLKCTVHKLHVKYQSFLSDFIVEFSRNIFLKSSNITFHRSIVCKEGGGGGTAYR